MAEVRIEDGKITRVFHEGRGAEVTESWLSRSGEPVSQRWAAWFEAPHGLSEGDTVTVVGRVGVKVESWQPKDGGELRHSAKLSVNDARIIGEPSSATSSSGVTEPWDAGTPNYSEEAPF